MSVKKLSAGASEHHELLINKYCENQNFLRCGSNGFLKIALLNDYTDKKINLIDFFNVIKGKKTASAVNNRIKKTKAKVIEGIDTDVCLSCDNLGCECCDYGDDIINPSFPIDWMDDTSMSSLMEKINKDLRVYPDCWRINNGKIQIVEINNTSPVSIEKLIKISYLDDLLYQALENSVRIDLFEYHISSASFIKHDLNYLFDLVETSMQNNIESLKNTYFKSQDKSYRFDGGFDIERLN